MILVHGECGSGKSAALRALEAAPPAGVRAAYVPVPTLDLAGLARWCLDRLQIAPGADPLAALRETAHRGRLVLLIDDADRLPLDTALAARRLERDSAGNLVLVAACEPAQIRTPAILALGLPSREIAFSEQNRVASSRELKACLAPWATTQARVDAPAMQRTGAQYGAAPEPMGDEVRVVRDAPRRVIVAPPVVEPVRPGHPHASPPPLAPQPRRITAPPPKSPPAPKTVVATHAQPAPPGETVVASSPPPPPSSQARTVPLSLAIAMSITAFLVPVAFAAGYLLGTGPAPAAPDLVAGESPPAVSAPPPAEDVAQAARPARATRRESPTVRANAKRARARAPAGAAPAVEPTPSPDSAASDGEEWGPAPSLLSVEPGAAAPW